MQENENYELEIEQTVAMLNAIIKIREELTTESDWLVSQLKEYERKNYIKSLNA